MQLCSALTYQLLLFALHLNSRQKHKYIYIYRDRCNCTFVCTYIHMYHSLTYMCKNTYTHIYASSECTDILWSEQTNSNFPPHYYGGKKQNWTQKQVKSPCLDEWSWNDSRLLHHSVSLRTSVKYLFIEYHKMILVCLKYPLMNSDSFCTETQVHLQVVPAYFILYNGKEKAEIQLAGFSIVC